MGGGRDGREKGMKPKEGEREGRRGRKEERGKKGGRGTCSQILGDRRPCYSLRGRLHFQMLSSLSVAIQACAFRTKKGESKVQRSTRSNGTVNCFTKLRVATLFCSVL